MFKENDRCPECRKGKLSQKVFTEVFQYKRQELELKGCFRWECDVCKEIFITPQQSSLYEEVLVEFFNRVDKEVNNG